MVPSLVSLVLALVALVLALVLALAVLVLALIALLPALVSLVLAPVSLATGSCTCAHAHGHRIAMAKPVSIWHDPLGSALWPEILGCRAPTAQLSGAAQK